jgi:hypothetical protein
VRFARRAAGPGTTAARGQRAIAADAATTECAPPLVPVARTSAGSARRGAAAPAADKDSSAAQGASARREGSRATTPERACPVRKAAAASDSALPVRGRHAATPPPASAER